MRCVNTLNFFNFEFRVLCVVPLCIAVTHGLKWFIKKMPPKFQEDDLVNWVEHLNDWRSAWKDSNAEEESCDYIAIASVLDCFINLFRVLLKDVSLKPTIHEVRDALRIFEETVQRRGENDATEKKIHDLVMTFAMSKAGEAIMKGARDHSQVGLRDANINSLFSIAVDAFQEPLEEKRFYEDTVAFVLSGNNGMAHDAVSFTSVIANCQTLAIARCVLGVVHVA